MIVSTAGRGIGNFTMAIDNTMPGDAGIIGYIVQCITDQSVIFSQTNKGGNLPVGKHLPRRYGPYQ